VDADALADAFLAAWSGRDPEAFGATCSPRLHYEDPLTAEPLMGPGELGEHAERLWAAVPDARVDGTGERPASARYLAVPWRLEGTHTDAVGGVAATGRSLRLHGIFFCEVERSRLLRVRGFFDVYDAGVQLGLLPARGGVGERAMLALRGFGVRLRPR
jgi:steroid delta-isomerase-like uncharacterized protein